MSRPPAKAPESGGGSGFLSGGGEAGVLIRDHDWAATPLGPLGPLGPLDAWPQSLRTALRLLLNARYPMQLWWGPERLVFHNDAYRASIGLECDPCSIGRPGREDPQIWNLLGPQIEKVMSSGEAIQRENVLVPVKRKTRPEDGYWSHSFAPIDDSAAPNGVGGVLLAWAETTATVVHERHRDAAGQRLRRLLEEMPGFITILRGPDHVYEFINDTHHQLFGSGDWLGKPVREAFPDIAGQGFLELLSKVYQTGEQRALHGAPIRFHRAPGTAVEEHFLDFVYAPLTDPASGAINGIFCHGFDVTDVHVAREKLRESESRLQSILDTVPDAMIVTDEDGVVQTFSPAAEVLYRWSKEEMVGQSFLMLTPSSDREALDADMERYADLDRTVGHPRILRGQRKDGSTFPLELFVGEAKFGTRRLFTGFVRDLSERQAAEVRLQELQSELLHVSRLSAMGEMAAGLAHELNQPLSAISNYLRGGRRLLETENRDSRALAPIEKAADQALRAGEIIRRLRNFIASGESDRAETSLKGLLEEGAALGLMGARELGIDSRFDLNPAVDAVVVDRVQVQQVVLNLLRNAIEAMKDSPRRELHLTTTETDDGMAMVSVSDSGPGISSEIAPRLFQPFVTTKGGQGMGVGLSICRGIIESHGGRIWTEPNPSGGSVFRFTLPRTRREADIEARCKEVA
ncbi:MAG TPA: PAS domain S-box protein [Caulobacteraceae bacterium]|nr:PAS domain S-box protein [Caulobacteraceae bacterium]